MDIWQIDSSSKVSIYRQLAQRVRHAVEMGYLHPGDPVPSQRQLSSILGVSRSTVVKAMELMADEGLIDISERKKAVVGSLATKGIDWDAYFRRSANQFSKIRKDSRIDGKAINLSRYSVSEEYWPLEHEMPVLDKIQDALGLRLASLPRDYIHGMAPLQEAMVAYLKRTGIECRKEELLLLASPVQATSFVAELFLAPGVELCFSSPSDIGYFRYLDSFGAELRPLPYDSEGLIPDSLLEEGNPRNNKILFLWSSCTPPTNISLSKARRDKIYRICRSLHIPIIDNSMLEAYNISREGIHSVKSIDTAGAVIQIGAFPRGLAAGTWLAWVVADKKVIDRLSDIKEKRFRSLDRLSQAVILKLLEDGSLERYLEAVRRKLREDNPGVNALIEKHLGDLADWNREQSGWCYWLTFRKPVDTKLLYEARQGISFNPGCFYNPSDTFSLMLNPPGVSRKAFEEGLKKLREQILYLFPDALQNRT